MSYRLHYYNHCSSVGTAEPTTGTIAGPRAAVAQAAPGATVGRIVVGGWGV